MGVAGAVPVVAAVRVVVGAVLVAEGAAATVREDHRAAEARPAVHRGDPIPPEVPILREVRRAGIAPDIRAEVLADRAGTYPAEADRRVRRDRLRTSRGS
jgi:hypothetical protein